MKSRAGDAGQRPQGENRQNKSEKGRKKTIFIYITLLFAVMITVIFASYLSHSRAGVQYWLQNRAGASENFQYIEQLN